MIRVLENFTDNWWVWIYILFSGLYLYILDMSFKSGCSNYWEAWLGPSSMGEKACDPMWSGSRNPLWWHSTYAGEGVGKKYWRNVWKIWNGSSWFCLNCPGTYSDNWHSHREKYICVIHTITFQRKWLMFQSSQLIIDVKGEALWIQMLIFLASFWSMNLKLKSRRVKTNMALLKNEVILFLHGLNQL